MACHLFFEQFDDWLRGVVFQEEVEIAFIIVDEAAECRDIDFSQVRIHDILHWQVEYLL